MTRPFLLLLFCFVLASCTTIPQQAPQLSEELGTKINSLEKSHLTLLHAYFDQKRAEVDRFVNDVWVPEFASTFFSNTQIQEAWDHIVQSKDTRERLDFLLAVTPPLQAQIAEKRQELIKPLNDLEHQVEAAVREEFELARSANNTITSFLTTTAKIDENRQRYMKMLNISEDKISSVISETDDVLAKLVTKSEETLGKEEDLKKYQAQAKEYLEKLKDLKNKLSKK
jgi:hypothetical protein